jgi:hypothetical protein
MMGGAPAAPRSHEELASKGIPRRTGVPGLAVVGGVGIGSPASNYVAWNSMRRSDPKDAFLCEIHAESATEFLSSVIL